MPPASKKKKTSKSDGVGNVTVLPTKSTQSAEAGIPKSMDELSLLGTHHQRSCASIKSGKGVQYPFGDRSTMKNTGDLVSYDTVQGVRDQGQLSTPVTTASSPKNMEASGGIVGKRAVHRCHYTYTLAQQSLSCDPIPSHPTGDTQLACSTGYNFKVLWVIILHLTCSRLCATIGYPIHVHMTQ